MDQNAPQTPADLRAQLIELKAKTLKLNAVLMGLKHTSEEIAPAALAKITQDAQALSDEELVGQIEKWTSLHQRAATALSTRPTPPGSTPRSS